MNDVLPKPFTKSGLLAVLEKHLSYLKKNPDGMDAPLSASGPSLGQSAGHSVKDEASPAPSPATMNSWGQSPRQIPGVSPIQQPGPAQYMQVGPTAGYGMDSNGMQYQPPHTPISNGPRQGPHRRQVSEISGGQDLNDPKRQRIYGHPSMVNPMQAGRPG